MQLVVPSAVRNAVSAATITFTASSTILCFFIISSFLFLSHRFHRSHRFFTSSGLFKVTQNFTEITEIFVLRTFLRSHRNSQKSQKFYVLRTFLRSHRNSQKSRKFTSSGLFKVTQKFTEITEIYVLRTFIVHRNLGNNRFAFCAQPVPKALSVISVNFCVTIKNLCESVSSV